MFSKPLAIVALFAIVFLAVAMIPLDAEAQDNAGTKNVDKDRATKKGVSNSLASGKIGKEGEGTTRAQAAIGLGSCVVAYIVVKWL